MQSTFRQGAAMLISGGGGRGISPFQNEARGNSFLNWTMSCADLTSAETFTSYINVESDSSPSQLEDDFERIWGEEDKNQVLSLPDSPSEVADPGEVASKLCGYLNKHKIGARGKVFKKRWFVFSDRACKLLYYRTPQDLVPLGDIDIAGATFSFNVGNSASASGRENVFEISSERKVMQLEAPDRQTMMYWLQELQSKRRSFSHRRTEKARVQSAESQAKILQEAIESNGGTKHQGEKQGSPPDLMSVVNIPNMTVGMETASVSSSNVSDISFTNWRTELRNLLAGMRPVNRRSSDCEAMKNVARHRKQAPAVGQLIEIDNEEVEEKGNAEVAAEPDAGPSRTKDTAWNTFRRRIKARSGPAGTEISQPLSGSGNTPCVKCKELENFISNLRTDNQVLEEELIVHQELVKQIEKQNRILKKEKETNEEMSLCFTDHDQIEVLRARDKQIVELEHLLAATKEEVEAYKQQTGDLKRQIVGLQGQITAYHRSIKAKDEQIVKFVEQINDLEGGSLRDGKQGSFTLLETDEVNRLRDAVEGYELQNRFLSKEILELNRLRADDVVREEQMMLQSKEWEAKFYQIQSKYLLCLDELRMPVRGNEQPSEMVNQLLEDAMENDSKPAEEHSRSRTRSSVDKYDEYGFSKEPDDNRGSLMIKAHNSKRRSEMLTYRDMEKEMSHICKWENFLERQGRKQVERSPELKQLTRGGIPPIFRKELWKMFVGFYIKPTTADRDGRLYHTCLNTIRRTTLHNPATKQIELDLLRTLPHNRHYESFTSENVPKLRRVLLAYAHHNPHIGYCQGLNRLAAIALLFLEEEDAFWCMVAIIEHIMPNDYYSPTLQAAQADQRVLKEFLHEKCPRLMVHLEHNEVDISLFTFNWFLTIFVDNIPVETYLRIWDTFLYEGNKVLFRYAIAFLKYREEEIIACPNSMSIHNYLRTLGSDITDIDRVTQIAFTEINPFSMRQVNAKRQVHNEKIKAELAELDKLRQNFQRYSMTETELELLSDEDN